MAPHLPGNLLGHGVVTLHDHAHRLAEVAQHVPSVGDLDGARRADPRTLGVGAGPVVGEDLHARVRPQPGGQRLCRPVGQQVHHRVLLEVDQDRPVAVAAPPSPIIDRHHPRGRRGRRIAASGARRAQQRVRAHGHRQAGSEPCTGLAAHGQGDAPMQGGDTLGAARIGPSDVIQPLGEGPTRAIRLVAAEPPGSDPQGDRATLPGQVAQATAASAVDATRDGATAGTSGVPASGTCQDRHALPPREDLLDVERSGNEAEARGRHRRAPWSAARQTSLGDLRRQYNPPGCTISAGGPSIVFPSGLQCVRFPVAAPGLPDRSGLAIWGSFNGQAS